MDIRSRFPLKVNDPIILASGNQPAVVQALGIQWFTALSDTGCLVDLLHATEGFSWRRADETVCFDGAGNRCVSGPDGVKLAADVAARS